MASTRIFTLANHALVNYHRSVLYSVSKTDPMTLPKRNCVLVMMSHDVGHELVFRHFTSKVVVGTYNKRNKSSASKVANHNGRKKKP
jgi:hypothetical protein